MPFKAADDEDAVAGDDGAAECRGNQLSLANWLISALRSCGSRISRNWGK